MLFVFVCTVHSMIIDSHPSTLINHSHVMLSWLSMHCLCQWHIPYFFARFPLHHVIFWSYLSYLFYFLYPNYCTYHRIIISSLILLSYHISQGKDQLNHHNSSRSWQPLFWPLCNHCLKIGRQKLIQPPEGRIIIIESHKQLRYVRSTHTTRLLIVGGCR